MLLFRCTYTTNIVHRDIERVIAGVGGRLSNALSRKRVLMVCHKLFQISHSLSPNFPFVFPLYYCPPLFVFSSVLSISTTSTGQSAPSVDLICLDQQSKWVQAAAPSLSFWLSAKWSIIEGKQKKRVSIKWQLWCKCVFGRAISATESRHKQALIQAYWEKTNNKWWKNVGDNCPEEEVEKEEKDVSEDER